MTSPLTTYILLQLNTKSKRNITDMAATLPNSSERKPPTPQEIAKASGVVAGLTRLTGGSSKQAAQMGLATAGLVVGAEAIVSGGKSLGFGNGSPSSARLSTAGLLPGGLPSIQGIFGQMGSAMGGTTSPAASVSASAGTSAGSENSDWRLRISVGEQSGIFYKATNAGILAPLTVTNGVIFPYTPQITVSYQNNYGAQTLTHSMQPSRSFQNSEVSAINITGTFTAQTPEEADYVLAVIHFFRSASKMYFGTADDKNRIGAPPPVLFLNGFGQNYFPNVSTVLTSFVHNMGDDVDFTTAGWDSVTRVPTVSNIQITLIPQYSRTKMKSFNLDSFARGELINGKGNFI